MKFGRALLKLFEDDRGNRADQHERIYLQTQDQMSNQSIIPRGRRILNLLIHDMSTGRYYTAGFSIKTLYEIRLEGNR